VSRTIVDIHLLQTVPPSNLNRDDTGSPKTATCGGVRRARVSSQAWKKATRENFKGYLDATDLGMRTKRVVELVAERIMTAAPGTASDAALAAAEAVMSAAGITVKEPRGKKGAPAESGYLLFLSAQQIDALARLAADAQANGGAPNKNQAQALMKDKNSIDLALFGRMVADVTDLNVDASCQVAHALSTHAVQTEYDFFTAVDDHKAADSAEDAGAGMIGTIEFNSSTLYRFATIDVDLLGRNLGDLAATSRAVSAFLQAFTRSMPTGKQNTFANRTLPDAVVISVRTDQPVSYVGAFEEAVAESGANGRVRASIERLAQHATDIADAFGGRPVATWVTGVGNAAEPLSALGERVAFDEAVSAVAQLVEQRLASS
jgi:CRISPR system Cascade subunit CasC